MEYISTRNKNLKYNFKDIFFRGLAPDGGLFIPNQIKKYNEAEIKKLSIIAKKDFNQLAKKYGIMCKKLVENQKQRIDYWENKGNKKIK